MIEAIMAATGTTAHRRAAKKRKMKATIYLSLVAALAILMTACAAGVIVPITEQNADLIQGHWEGRFIRSSSDGRTRWQDQASLTIQGNTAEIMIGTLDFGKFAVEIRDNNVVVTHPNAPPRIFRLGREGDGTLTLTSTYNWQDSRVGTPRAHEVDAVRWMEKPGENNTTSTP